MKVFISHKQEDSETAKSLALMLRLNHTDYYLDVLDSTVAGDGKQLTDHIKQALNTCTDIMVVMSEKTRYSQWVPFEIGMAAQNDMPTVTFLSADVPLPDFLSYWPRLKTIGDVDKYVKIRKDTHDQIERRYAGQYAVASSRKAEETRTFYANLKSALK